MARTARRLSLTMLLNAVLDHGGEGIALVVGDV